MKKLIFNIAIILLTISLYPQSKLLLLMGDDGYKNAELKTYLASLTTPISSSYAKTLDTFISMVKDSLAIANLSDAFDVMYDLGGETTEQSLKNLVKRQHDATAVNSPTFTQWEGFTGNGTSSYLNTNYNPSTQAVVYDTANAHASIYCRTNVLTDAKMLTGAINYTSTDWRLEMNIRTTNMQSRLNNTTAANNIDLSHSNNIAGYHLTTRTNNVQTYYLNSLNQSTTNTAAHLKPIRNIYILANDGSVAATNFSTNQVAFASFGKSFSSSEYKKLKNCVEWLMDSKGKGVIP